VVWCGVVWCGVVWCGVVWCGVVWNKYATFVQQTGTEETMTSSEEALVVGYTVGLRESSKV